MNINWPASIVVVFACILSGFLAGVRYHQGAVPGHGNATGRKLLYYVDPMHPGFRSERAGTAPDCGMDLEPVYADGVRSDEPEAGGAQSTSASALTGAGRNQVNGVQISHVRQASGAHVLRLLGRVAADEAKIYTLNAGIEGFIQDVAPVTRGSIVKKDQLLATFSAPNAIMAIQTYILNIGAEERFRRSANTGSAEGQSLPAALANIQQRNQQLQNIGMSTTQMEEIKRTREVPERIRILSPAGGLVLSRNVSPGRSLTVARNGTVLPMSIACGLSPISFPRMLNIFVRANRRA